MSKTKDYEMICKIGQGSFGTVYKVKRKADKQVLVMKMIKVPTLSKKHQQESLHEVTILSSLNNPYIVKYYESFVENSTLHIIMEYCEKGDLSNLLKKQTLSEAKVWKFFIQICIGLEYLHSRQILHRDIKTLNIFLAADDSVRIGDLGVAKIMNNTAAFAQTQVGSPYYLSPELCEEKPYNNKSDVWALGCVLYEMCTGKHPFTAPNQAALILRIVKGTYAPLSFEFSPGLREIVELCLEKDLKKRPSIQSLLLRNDFEGKIQEFSIQVPFNSVLYKLVKPTDYEFIKESVKESIRSSLKSDTESKITAFKIVEEVQKQVIDNKKALEKKMRPFSAHRPENSRLDSPGKSKVAGPIKLQHAIFKTEKTDFPEVQSSSRIDRKSPHQPKKSLEEMMEKIQNSQIQPYFVVRNISPIKKEPVVSKTPAIRLDQHIKPLHDRQSSRLNVKPSTVNYESNQVFKQKVPTSAKFCKMNESIEDIQLVQNLPDFGKIKPKLSVKYLQESSPVKPANVEVRKKVFVRLARPLVEPAVVGLNKMEKMIDDDWTVLRIKEKESVKNEESLRKQCSNLRRDIIKMIGADKFNEMHGIFTSIITV
jgi:NIMA (never in mitosis gene a)-related kinase